VDNEDDCSSGALVVAPEPEGCLGVDGSAAHCCQPRLRAHLNLQGPDQRFQDTLRPGEQVWARLNIVNSGHAAATLVARRRSCHEGAGHLVVRELQGHDLYVTCMDGACAGGRAVWAGLVPPMSTITIDEVVLSASGDDCNPALAEGTYTLDSELLLLTSYATVESPSRGFEVLPQ